ncbi:hypothetical protein C4D60_Mb03t03640 [Musa balbisiana]|uniref:ADP/ATP translocase n=1 Tax=Musa balbisiana TaxID=52838 RepID=A0A4S8J7A0_MUSBA|nr:hypothetical protein C4D60_Mb03t03640 [Musa balbisiana]
MSYHKTLKSEGIAGLYRGFNISCVEIIVYRDLYFGMYDSLKPVLLTGKLQDSFFESFALLNGAGLASCPIHYFEEQRVLGHCSRVRVLIYSVQSLLVVCLLRKGTKRVVLAEEQRAAENENSISFLQMA